MIIFPLPILTEIRILFLNVNMDFNVSRLRNHSIGYRLVFPLLISSYCCVLPPVFHILEIKATQDPVHAYIEGKHSITETLNPWLLNDFIPSPSPPFLFVLNRLPLSSLASNRCLLAQPCKY